MNNKPAIGGLFDLERSGIVCPTDGHNFINTPGYFGHINLANGILYTISLHYQNFKMCLY